MSDTQYQNLLNLISAGNVRPQKIILVRTDLSEGEIELFLNEIPDIHFHKHIHSCYNGDTLVDSLALKFSEWLPNDIKTDLFIHQIRNNHGIERSIYEPIFSSVLTTRTDRTVIQLCKEDCVGLGIEELKFLQGILKVFSNRCTIFVVADDDDWCKEKIEYYQPETIETAQIIMEKVYISHKHKIKESDEAIRLLTAEFRKRGIEYSIDTERMKIQDSILDYADEIADGKHIVVVIVKEYLKSLRCMYEISKIISKGDAKDKVYLITDRQGIVWDNILKETRAYWDRELEEEKQNISPDGSSQYSIEKLKQINFILNHLGDIWEFVNDIISKDVIGFNSEDAVEISEKIQQKMAADVNKTIQAPNLQDPDLKRLSSPTVYQSGKNNFNINGDFYGNINL